MDSYTPTIKTENVSEGMVLDFENYPAEGPQGITVSIGEAEVVYVESTDGLGGIAFYVQPEGADQAFHVWAEPGHSYSIVS